MPLNAPSMLTTFCWNVLTNRSFFYSPSFTSSHVEEFTNIIRQSDFLKHLIIFKHEIKEPTNIWNYYLSRKSSDWTTSWSWRTWQRFDRRAMLVLSNRAKPCTSSNNHQKQKTIPSCSRLDYPKQERFTNHRNLPIIKKQAKSMIFQGYGLDLG